MVHHSVTYCDHSLPLKDCKSIVFFLKLIRYAMGHTLLTFRGEYYEYGAQKEIDEKELMIGGYESAWLADLVAGFILKNCQKHFWDCEFRGIYRDDVLY